MIKVDSLPGTSNLILTDEKGSPAKTSIYPIDRQQLKR